MRMKVLFACSLFLISGCVPNDLASDGEDSLLSNSAILGQQTRRPLSRKAAYLAMAKAEGGLLFIWEDPNRDELPTEWGSSPLKGISGSLHHCTMVAFNLSDRSMGFPRIEDFGFQVEIADAIYPLLPLSSFATEFRYPNTLKLLDLGIPKGSLPGHSMSKIYLACQLEDEAEPNPVPVRLITREGLSKAWFNVEASDLAAFIQRPSEMGLKKILSLD